MNITSPLGFAVASLHCGIKPEKDDLMLLFSETPASVAGLFTTNKVKAPPVKYSREKVKGGIARAIIVNSGNANACTGAQGFQDAREMASLTAEALKVPEAQVLVASTGVIGHPLPMDKVRSGIKRLPEQLGQDGERAALAITTTDAFPKTAGVKFGPYTVGGMAKGAGMIHPNMATTLCFLTTDAPVSPLDLQQALRTAIDLSFNSISVDGDTSTNDCALVLANGTAGGKVNLNELTEALTTVARSLARQVVQDGEGATRLVEITVEGAVSDAEAKQAAYCVASSLLVKTMIHGGEPNWGRVLAALGRAGVEMEEERTSLSFGGVTIVQQGVFVSGTWEAAASAMQQKEVQIGCHLGLGEGRARVLTCDLNEAYVRLNGSYLS
ncbi:MAG: arginine biosynthesis bifunctional protein ArgJ [Candidatus Xenobia bacterium]